MWFNRHPLNNSLVVFVHGIFGDSWGTWLGVPGIIQSMAEHDPWVRSYDFYSFQYDSTAFHQPQLIPFAVDGLRQLLNRVQEKYETVALVAHSQGGLLSKAFILEELLAGNGRSIKVDLLIALGTPHAGRKVLNPLHWTRKVPGLRRFGQLAQLASRSETIRFIRENWNDQHIMRRAGNPSSKRRYIRSVAVVGAYDVWAGGAGSEGYASDSEKVKQFVSQNSESVAEIIKLNRTDLPLEGVQTKTATVIMDFLIDCPRRPMRCLALDKMLQAYADRITGIGSE